MSDPYSGLAESPIRHVDCYNRKCCQSKSVQYDERYVARRAGPSAASGTFFTNEDLCGS